ncbi:MAG: Pre-rRNA-processing protein ipi3 [Bathelium mastoideum]|nr:MAG: Pre-rRNA-processing protein ipi3 [Bathelium mastoideum]
MLTQTFVASTSGTKGSPASATLKDASIFVHEYQPQPIIRTTFKKSATLRNCLAVGTSHIFAAQADKAVIHVYNREKGNQETLVPFPERIRSLTLTADGAVLILGTEGGRIFVWETCTGRQVATQAAHLQAVTTLVIDNDSTFLLSGSDDSNVHVWSLLEILSWSKNDSTSQSANKSLLRTLPDHRAAITSLILGHSVSSLNIAVSASQDSSCIVWNYQSGQALRTVFLPSAPVCLVLDPADRCFYTGFEDGSVQLVHFYHESRSVDVNVHDPSQPQRAVKPREKDRWDAGGQNLGTTLSADLSYDGMTLLTGHESGKVICWDIGAGRFHSTLCDLHAPVTNLLLEKPTGFAGNVEAPRYKIHSVTKPRFDLSTTGQGIVPSAYTFTGQFISDLPNTSPHLYQSGRLTGRERFQQSLLHPSFPSSLLESGIAELAALHANPSHPSSNRASLDHDADFLALDGETTSPPNGTMDAAQNGVAPPAAQLETENQTLRDQMAALQRTLSASFDQLEHLRREQKVWLKWEREKRRKGEETQERRRERAERAWTGEDVGGEVAASPGDSSSSSWESSGSDGG